MTKHTQGPWKVDDYGYRVIIDYEIDHITDGWDKNRTFGYGCDHKFICDLNDGEYHEYSCIIEQKANARLIAAAPCLLEALQNIIRNYGEMDGPRRMYKVKERWANQARAAIAKATGEV